MLIEKLLWNLKLMDGFDTVHAVINKKYPCISSFYDNKKLYFNRPSLIIINLKVKYIP